MVSRSSYTSLARVTIQARTIQRAAKRRTPKPVHRQATRVASQLSPHRREAGGGGCRGAFTLIELLVVIAIIAVLAALLVPALKRARESGINTVCVSAEHQFGVAMSMYALEHDNRLVPASLGTDQAFDVLLDPYLETLPAAGNTAAKKGGLWTCPADYLEPNRSYVRYQRRSYGMNLYLTQVFAWARREATTNLDELPRRAVVLGEAWEAVIGTRSELGAAQVWNGLSGLAVFNYASNLFGLYHFQAGGNYLFSDGSVEYYRVADIRDRPDITAPHRENGLFYWE